MIVTDFDKTDTYMQTKQQTKVLVSITIWQIYFIGYNLYNLQIREK